MDTVHSAITEPVRRLEVFTGAGRRRTWSNEDKARIVAEIAASGDLVCAVARRHGLSPQQLFGWRRQLREAAAGILKRKNCSLCRRWWMWTHRRPRFAGGAKHHDASPNPMSGSSRLRSTALRSGPAAARTQTRLQPSSRRYRRTLDPSDRAQPEKCTVCGLRRWRRALGHIASLIETCKLNDVDRLAYLTDVLTRSCRRSSEQ